VFVGAVCCWHQQEGDQKNGAPGAEPPLFGWMEGAACICVFLAWRLQNQIAAQERREAEAAEPALNPAANESDTDESDGDDDSRRNGDAEGGN
jgi:hypothetical protein